MYEELLMNEESMKNTENELIHIGKPIEMDDAWFEKMLRKLDEAVCQETDKMMAMVMFFAVYTVP